MSRVFWLSVGFWRARHDLGFVTVVNDDERADRQLNAHRVLSTRNLNGLVVGIKELNQRFADLAGRRVLSVDNDQRAPSR